MVVFFIKNSKVKRFVSAGRAVLLSLFYTGFIDPAQPVLIGKEPFSPQPAVGKNFLLCKSMGET
jgi:hypothetical protein